ncbi:hypothetical protein [Bradyrhizobium sp. STM 3561]|uniref:hypothetical protein n=1 Tax=Bradyrhizobium sp. STM 3561 TaxID=578923 RepID=UPI00388DBD7C
MSTEQPVPQIDLGEFDTVQVTVDADGKPVLARRIKRHPTHTGGFNADGTPTRARRYS